MNTLNLDPVLRRPSGALTRAICVALGVLALPPASIAAEKSPSVSGSLEEVTVSATKREESVHDVPLSITAISADTLERAGVTTFLDYAAKVPAVTFSSGHGLVEGRQIAIRGIQGTNTTGFYIDDMPIDPTIDPRVVDLSRLEVLRGPQGTLYGARSMGGTIRLITEAPDTRDFSARVHGSGSQVQDGGGSGYQLDATINAPLITDHLALRITGYGGDDGSFISRSFPSTPGGSAITTLSVGRNTFAGGTASLFWKVTDDFSVRSTILTQVSSQNGFPLADSTANTMAQARPFDTPELLQDKWTYGGVTIKYVTAVGDITSSSGWFSRTSHEVEDTAQVLSAILGTPLLPTADNTWQPRHSFVEELRFVSRFTGSTQLVAGVFIQRGKSNYNQYWSTPGLNAAFGGALGSDLVYIDWHPTKTRESAGFGELTYKFSDRWSAIFGLRYSKIDSDTQVVQGGPGAGGFPGGASSSSENSTTPKIEIKYEVSADTNFYLLASKGFRPGAPQIPPPPTICASDYANLNITPEALASYKSDSLWNYEIGAKTRALDRRLTINAAAYWIEWKDLQQNLLLTCGYSYTSNVGAARSRGGELEVQAVPIDGLTLSAGIGYTNAEITQASALLPTPVGAPVQQVAPWTVALSADYSFPLTADLRGVVRADNGYTDHSFSASNDVANPRLRPSYDVANLRFGVRAGRWDVMAFVSNLANTHANLGDNESQGAELPGRPRILVNPPRTLGIEGTMRW
jgi:iron complex outermembrane receptor protein